MKIVIKTTTFLLIILIFAFPNHIGHALNNKSNVPKNDFLYTDIFQPYEKYYEHASKFNMPIQAIDITKSKGNVSDKAIIEGEEGVFEFHADQDSAYNILLEYTPLSGASSLEYSVFINKKIPFNYAAGLVLNRNFKDQDDNNVEKSFDNKGNEIAPNTLEIINKQNVFIRDSRGYVKSALLFGFVKGKNTISIKALRGSFVINSIKLLQEKALVPYNDYFNLLKTTNESRDTPLKIQAENTTIKSNSELVLKIDRTSASLEPKINGKSLINSINSGSNNGQWVEYQCFIKTSGLYRLDIKYKNNNSGISAYRNIYLDGKIPYLELQGIKLPPSRSWQMFSTPQIYISSGMHKIRIETVLGEYGEILESIDSAVFNLSEAYKSTIMYLGVNPDVYRDYDVESTLYSVLEIFKEETKQLHQISEQIFSTSKNKNGITAIIDQFSFALNAIVKKPDLLPKRLEQFRSNLSALASMSNTLSNTPVSLDYISISPTSILPDAPEASFTENVINEFSNFLNSFYYDYNYFNDNKKSESIKVWVTTGRDQSSIIKALTDTLFIPQNKFNVEIKLVQPATLLSSIVAGINPDAVLQTSYADPVNFAIRGAVMPLNKNKDYEEISKRFSKSSLEPLAFAEKQYGLPETETYLMMFYRSDILKRLNLEIPNTWEETIDVITELQKNNLYFGFPQGANANIYTFGSFLLQNNAEFYQKNSYLSALDSEQSVNSFTFLTDLFSNYKLPITYDFITRFRIGEMPLAIGDYTMYNSLQVAAPEIKNMWSFAPIPGTKKTDGTIDRSTINTGTASIILSNSKKHDQSWEYLKWWTSDEVQAEYGKGIERRLGPSARYPTANINAIKMLPWSNYEINILKEQLKWVIGVEAVPGGYFTSRHVDNAFRNVVISGSEPRETLREYVRIINTEIINKCKELNISLER